MVTIKKNPKKYNEFAVTMKLTAGKILVLKHALQNYPTSLSEEVEQMLVSAMEECNDPMLKDEG